MGLSPRHQNSVSLTSGWASSGAYLPTPVGVGKAAAAVLLVILGGALVPAVLIGVLILLAIDGLRSTRVALRNLMLVYLVRALNPAFFGEMPELMMPSLLAVSCCCIRIYGDAILGRKVFPRLCRFLLIFVAFVVCTSFLASEYITISFFKLGYFAFVSLAVVWGFTSTSDGPWVVRWMINVYFAVFILSVPLVFHDYGYFRDAMGFQGILNHPQEYAIFMAPFAALLLAHVISAPDRNPFLWVLLTAVVTSLILTRSRTGMVAMLAGVGFGYLLIKARALKPGALLKVSGVAVAVAAGLTVAILLNPGELSYLVQSFLLKEGGDSVGEAFETSRGFVIVESIGNFLSNPLVGVGFGINASELRPSVPVYEPLTGLPISFPTEKGNLVIAVLEETGIVGFCAFLLFLVAYLREVRAASNVFLASVALCALCTNVAEMTFFSMNSFGLMSWLLIAAALLPERHESEDHTARLRQELRS